MSFAFVYLMILLSLSVAVSLFYTYAQHFRDPLELDNNATLNQYGSIYCTEDRFDYNVSSGLRFRGKLFCFLPLLGTVRGFTQAAVIESAPDVLPQLLQCALKLVQCVDENSGKVIGKCANDLKTLFVQKKLQNYYEIVQNHCLKGHYESLTKDYNSYRGYANCLALKMAKVCPAAIPKDVNLAKVLKANEISTMNTTTTVGT